MEEDDDIFVYKPALQTTVVPSRPLNLSLNYISKFKPEPKSLFIMIIGHGSFLTHKRENNIYDLNSIYFPTIQASIYTFAPPGETACYPPDRTLGCIETLQHIEPPKTNEEFIQTVEYSQKKNIGFTYDDPLWANGVTKDGINTVTRNGTNAANLILDSKRYYEKQFTDAPEIYGNGESGVYTFTMDRDFAPYYQFNEFMKDGRILLSSIVKFFSDFGISKLYIFDVTCSVFDIENVETPMFPETRNARIMRKDVVRLTTPRKGGKSRRKRANRQKKTIKRKNIHKIHK
jgi:hypothetical protein